jgi:hypothetical protein
MLNHVVRASEAMVNFKGLPSKIATCHKQFNGIFLINLPCPQGLNLYLAMHARIPIKFVLYGV